MNRARRTKKSSALLAQLRDPARRLDEYVEALLRAEATRRDHDRGHGFVAGEKTRQPGEVGHVRVGERGQPRGVADDAHPGAGDTALPDLGSLAVGNAHHMIHELQVPAVERLVPADLPVLSGPAAGHRHRGNPDPPGGYPAEQVCLVAVAEEHVGPLGPQEPGQFPRRGPQSRRVVLQFDAGEPGRFHGSQELAAAAAFGEARESGGKLRRQVRRQPEHLPLRAAEERARGEMDDVHSRPPDRRGEPPRGGSVSRRSKPCRGQFVRKSPTGRPADPPPPAFRVLRRQLPKPPPPIACVEIPRP